MCRLTWTAAHRQISRAFKVKKVRSTPSADFDHVFPLVFPGTLGTNTFPPNASLPSQLERIAKVKRALSEVENLPKSNTFPRYIFLQRSTMATRFSFHHLTEEDTVQSYIFLQRSTKKRRTDNIIQFHLMNQYQMTVFLAS
jgi:hypothetical protein